MSSSIDSKGIVRILFGNNSITPLQSISELYHNSYDSRATRVNMYRKIILATEENDDEEWFVFEDNGTGMSMKNMEQYLTLLSIERDEKKDKTTKHGKYGFGGKQAIFQLSGITNTDKSDRALVISKQTEKEIVCCEFEIQKLLKKGWSDQIEVCSLSDDNTRAAGFRTFVQRRASEITSTEFHGTIILIKMNKQLESLFADIENIKYNTSINFYKCLNTCKFWCGESQDNITKVEMYDPLHYDEVDPKYKKEVTVKCYSDIDDNRYFSINDKYIPIINKLGHSKSHFIDFKLKKNELMEIGEFKIYISMLYYYYGIDKLPDRAKLTEYERENCIYLCRNDSVIGTYAKIKHSVTRTSRVEYISQWMRVRISIESTSNLNNTMDSIFGINMNKGSIIYSSLPDILQKTLLMYTTDICNEFKRLHTEHSDKPNIVTKPAELETEQVKPLTVDEHITLIKGKKMQDKLSTSVKRQVEQKNPLIKENDIRDKLAAKEKGKCEVYIGGKRIDVLTDDYVIEIKRYDDRLDALKVLFYYEYYLDRKPRIHLFDQYGEKCLREPVFEEVCKKYNIKLTYEL
jgi:hypothetical protein